MIIWAMRVELLCWMGIEVGEGDSPVGSEDEPK